MKWINKYLTKDYCYRTVKMLISVCTMGICVSILVMTQFGPDPCSAFNYGMAGITGLSFGTYQFTFNAILFLLIFFQNKKLFGIGTLGNMIIVGYAADFTSWLIRDVAGITEITSFWLRLGIMIPVLLVFVTAAGIYMNMGLGTAPYDALVFLIHAKLQKVTGKIIKFRYIRMGYDAFFTIGAFIIGGEVGVVTVLMVILIGPAVDSVSKTLNRMQEIGNKKKLALKK